MKRMKFHAARLVATALLLLVAPAPSRLDVQSSQLARLTVQVTHARDAKGTIRVALFRSGEGFPGDTSKALRAQAAQIDPKTLSGVIVFAGIPRGTYAVSVFHDENMNGKLDKNFVGMPKEGYGASNNPEKKMRAPTFEEASFSLNRDQTVEIKLMY